MACSLTNDMQRTYLKILLLSMFIDRGLLQWSGQRSISGSHFRPPVYSRFQHGQTHLTNRGQTFHNAHLRDRPIVSQLNPRMRYSDYRGGHVQRSSNSGSTVGILQNDTKSNVFSPRNVADIRHPPSGESKAATLISQTLTSSTSGAHNRAKIFVNPLATRTHDRTNTNVTFQTERQLHRAANRNRQYNAPNQSINRAYNSAQTNIKHNSQMLNTAMDLSRPEVSSTIFGTSRPRQQFVSPMQPQVHTSSLSFHRPRQTTYRVSEYSLDYPPRVVQSRSQLQTVSYGTSKGPNNLERDVEISPTLRQSVRSRIADRFNARRTHSLRGGYSRRGSNSLTLPYESLAARYKEIKARHQNSNQDRRQLSVNDFRHQYENSEQLLNRIRTTIRPHGNPRRTMPYNNPQSQQKHDKYRLLKALLNVLGISDLKNILGQPDTIRKPKTQTTVAVKGTLPQHKVSVNGIGYNTQNVNDGGYNTQNVNGGGYNTQNVNGGGYKTQNVNSGRYNTQQAVTTHRRAHVGTNKSKLIADITAALGNLQMPNGASVYTNGRTAYNRNNPVSQGNRQRYINTDDLRNRINSWSPDMYGHNFQRVSYESDDDDSDSNTFVNVLEDEPTFSEFNDQLTMSQSVIRSKIPSNNEKHVTSETGFYIDSDKQRPRIMPSFHLENSTEPQIPSIIYSIAED